MRQFYLLPLLALATVSLFSVKTAYTQQTAIPPEQISQQGSIREKLIGYGSNQSLFEKIYFIDQLFNLPYIEPDYNGIGIEGVKVKIRDFITDEKFFMDIETISEKVRQASVEWDKETHGIFMSMILDKTGGDLMNKIMGIRTTADSCHKSEPFCTGLVYTFPAGVNTGNAQAGPNYGCLSTRPNPVWYHMRILQPGNLKIKMVGTRINGNPMDIDFALWGPFNDPVLPCVSQLTANCPQCPATGCCPNNTTNPNFYPSGNLHDCSWSANDIEYANIVNGQTGQYFILLITNYSNAEGTITFSKESGSATTDCSIVPPPIDNNGPLCVGQTLQLTVINPPPPSATFSWSGPNNWTSTQMNPTIPNVNLSHAGTYTLVITLFGQTSDPVSTYVEIFAPPNPTVTGQAFPCQGSSHNYSVQFPQQGSTFEWVANGGQVTSGQGTATATIQWTASGAGSVRVTEDPLYCDPVLSPPLNVNISPLPSVPAAPSGLAVVCEGSTGVQYTTTGATNAVGYIWSLQPASAGTITGTGLNATVNYSPGFTGTANISVTGTNLCGQGQASQSLQVNVGANPAANAGNDVSIPHGTSTTLQGSATGGSQPYTYSWSPADKLLNPNVANPQTVNLFQTTVFTLTVQSADNCTDSDQVVVTITGGALGVTANATPAAVCPGSPSVLNAYPSGGSGTYTYAWTSNPPGFESYIQNPEVNPLQTTTYFVSVNDGFNTVTDQTSVTVWPLPLANAGIDQNIAHGTNTTLNGTATGGLPPYSYSWVPSEYLVNAGVSDPQTINLYQSRTFYLTVTDYNGCVGVIDSVRINVSGDALATYPSASPNLICQGASTQLFANPSGGSSNYTFIWTSDPPGFTSTLENPVVYPAGETLYQVTINDGFNSASGQVFVDIAASPVPFFTSDTVCRGSATSLFDFSSIQEGYIQSLLWYYNGTLIGTGTETQFIFPNHGQHQVTLSAISDLGCVSNVVLPVFVKQLPVIDIARRIPEDLRFFSPGGDTLYVCVFSSVTLDAGNPSNPNQLFEWSVGSEADTLVIGALGIGYELQRHTVTVTDLVSGCVNTRTLYVEFSMAACEFSVSNPAIASFIKVFPNPAKDVLLIEYSYPGQEITMSILNIHGQQVLPLETIHHEAGRLHRTDISGLLPGVYFIRFSNSKHIYTVKLIVSGY